MSVKIFIWHRRIGLFAVLFIIFLVLTGIALQHSDDLNLPSKFLTNTWLLNYYGIRPNHITTYQLSDQTISHAGETIYLSGKPTDVHTDALHGAVVTHDQIVLATSDSIIVCDHNGSILDEFTTLDGLSEAPLGIALTDQQDLVIRGANAYWMGNSDFTKWHMFEGSNLEWATPSAPSSVLRSMIESYDMGMQISLERFLLDAHSGRFFGKYGVYVIDAAAILVLTLSITGIWLWFTRR